MNFREIKLRIVIGIPFIAYVIYVIIDMFVFNSFLSYRQELTPATDIWNVKIWGYRIMIEMIFGAVIIFITGLLIAKLVGKENKNYLNGIIGGLFFAFYGIIFYILRFGVENYIKYNDFFLTILWSALLGGLGFYLYKRIQFKKK